MQRIEKGVPHVVRIALGLVFVVFGLNWFLHFLPEPKMTLSPQALGLLGGLEGTGYMWPLIKSIEVAAGALLLANLAVPFALVLLAPLVVNIALFHFALMTPNAITFTVLAAEIYLAWVYRDAFRGLFARRAVPARRAQAERAVARGLSPEV